MRSASPGEETKNKKNFKKTGEEFIRGVECGQTASTVSHEMRIA